MKTNSDITAITVAKRMYLKKMTYAHVYQTQMNVIISFYICATFDITSRPISCCSLQGHQE